MLKQALDNFTRRVKLVDERLPMGPVGVGNLTALASNTGKAQSLRQMDSVAALFSVIDLIAQDMSAVVWKVFRLTPSGERVEILPSMRPLSRTENAGQRLHRL